MALQATQDPRYLEAGAAMIQALFQLNWVEGGWAGIHSVSSMQLEDHMPSYFLAEACKYLFLLFDDSFVKVRQQLSQLLSAGPFPEVSYVVPG